ncbi:OmpA family protein [Yoonia sp. 208BN28-4]|uniref:OmpA family protein n=1 Tax=Yoonia sp. 208BN28-4 TaxID=3126505 RepID=UPI0030B113C0
MIRHGAVLLAYLYAGSAAAQDIRLPGNAVEQASEIASPDSHVIATGPWDQRLPHMMIEGTVSQTVWRIPGAGLTTLQVIRPLEAQIKDAGYEVVYACDTAACGGFDFRFAIPVLPPPAMQVDLGDFRYLSAQRITDDGLFGLSVLVSGTAQAAFVQITQVNPEQAAAPRIASEGQSMRPVSEPVATGTPPESLTASLDQIGRAVLDDLTFATGAAQLTDAPSRSLRELADYLLAQPDLTVALVGHTDASGSLDANIALSKRRAGAVLDRLATQYNVPRRQLEAEGMGYLSPVANNRSEAGREANRRVEVIITSTQ